MHMRDLCLKFILQTCLPINRTNDKMMSNKEYRQNRQKDEYTNEIIHPGVALAIQHNWFRKVKDDLG